MCDIFISPELGGVGMLSFDAESVARMTSSGYKAASAFEEKFLALKELVKADSTSYKEKRPEVKKAINILQNKVLISGIEMEGVEKDIEEWVRRKCTFKIGDHVCKSDIDKSVSIYYGTGDYSSITYTIHEDSTSEDGYILRFKFVENGYITYDVKLKEYRLKYNYSFEDLYNIEIVTSL